MTCSRQPTRPGWHGVMRGLRVDEATAPCNGPTLSKGPWRHERGVRSRAALAGAACCALQGLLASVMLFPGLADAAETVGLLQVQPPLGWQRSAIADGLDYGMPPDTSGAGCRIRVRPPRAAPINATATFGEEWLAATTGTAVAVRTPTPEVRPWREGWQSTFAALTSDHSLLWLVMLTDGKRAQSMLLTGRDACRESFVAFLDSADLAPAPVQAQAPHGAIEGVEASGLVGLWEGRKTVTTEIAGTPYGPHRYTNYVTRLARYTLLLLPDGTYTEHPPPGGMSDPSLRQNAAGRSRYSVADGGKWLLLHGSSPSVEPRRVELRDGVPRTDHGPMRRTE